MHSLLKCINRKSFITSSIYVRSQVSLTKHVDLNWLENKENLEWKSLKKPPFSKLISHYLKLSKIRLTSLVVFTTFNGFIMASNSIDPSLLFFTLIGTGLTSASAASLNQFLEVPFDSQMSRTRNRPLVLGQLEPHHAFTFSLVSGITGLTILGTMLNPLTMILGASNLLLYSFIYTPMKRANILNTWIGSVVGAIPPLMGCTAATNTLNLSFIILALFLYSWQFPHFNALSWNLRHDYARAGYRMMSVTNPQLCVRTALRHSMLVALYCELMCIPCIGLTDFSFGFNSIPLNIYLIYLCWKFKKEANSTNSRKLFRYSLVHLPALLILMLLSKINCKNYLNKKNNDNSIVNS